MRLIINKLQGRFVTRVTKITFFVPNSVTKMNSRTSSWVIVTLFFGLKEKKWRFRGLRKTVAIRWFFHSRKHAYFILKHSKFTRFFLPSRASISPSISSSEDRCLVWLVYLIHEPDRTSSLRADSQSRKYENYEVIFPFHCIAIIRAERLLILPTSGYKTRQLPPLSGPSRWMIPSAFSLARCFSMALGVTPMISASFRAE